MDDTKLGKNWQVMQKFQNRHLYDVPKVQENTLDTDKVLDANDDVYQDDESFDMVGLFSLMMMKDNH